MWREIGLQRVFVGLEFFRDEDLAFIRKGATVHDNEQAVKILHDLGIDVYASFIVRPEFERHDFASLKQFCRRLKLDFASFSVLTPLPGTDLYEEVEDKLLTNDFDYFDFIHTLLPTRLSLRNFYSELHRLYRTAVPPSRGLSFLAKYPWREIPGTMTKFNRWLKRLKRLHLDYP